MAKILVVEDEHELGSTIRDWLILEGHRVELVPDGSTALKKLTTIPYDLIILDVIIPRMSGLEVCAKYRQQGGCARILMLTGKGTLEAKQDGFEAGTDDYITKPFDLKELSIRVNALMRRSLNLSGNQLFLDDLVIDLATFEVSRGGQRIKILPQELALLEFMAKHPNRIFSVDSLIQSVWHGRSSPETVRTHIKTLRKKIDLPGHTPLIKTVHRMGYTLCAEER